MPMNAALRLKKNIKEIMKLWEERVNVEVKAAHLQKSLALQDSLPEYLKHLTDALSKNIDRTEARVKKDKLESTRLGMKHGKDRALSKNYTIDQLILEYQILRQVICDLLEKDKPLTAVEREVIVCSIEQAVNDAASEYSETMKNLEEQMSQILAHDLRNPLTTAKICTQLIIRKPDDKKINLGKAHLILTSLDRIDSMISDLLDASKAEAGEEIDLTLQECDFDWIIREIANEANIASLGGFIVRSMGQCIGRWDKNALRRLVENLVSNAVKYGQVGATISLSLEQDENYATLSVNNKGEVIAEEDRSIIFQKFKRAKSSENEIGWGIGLTGVQDTVDKHKGTMRVESDRENGTTFVITLPKSIDENPETPDRAHPGVKDDKSMPQSTHH